MTEEDTQWPRYQVFKQDRPGLPFENVGTVHAPDSEMAMQNARDVFARRPECSGLWVVPAEAILARPGSTAPAGEGDVREAGADIPEAFLVFVKREHRGTHVHRGALEARSPAEAMALAQSTLDDPEHPGIVWWVCPARVVRRSSPEDAASMFGPAQEKHYRQPAHYRTDGLMRAIKNKRREEKGGST